MKSSAVSKLGIGHSSPASWKDPGGHRQLVGRVDHRGRGTWVRNEPGMNRMPTLRLPALYGTGVILDDGPLRRTRFACRS